MIVSHEAQFVFFHNPKVAGTSMRSALARYHDDPRVFMGLHRTRQAALPLDLAHLRCWELEALVPDLLAQTAAYRSVILVRNPYRRFISAVIQYYKAYQPDTPLGGMTREQQKILVEQLIGQLSTRITDVFTDCHYVHFSPQTWFILSGERHIPRTVIAVDDTGSFRARVFEALALPLSPVGRENASKIDLTHVLESPRVRAFIQAFYQTDFAFLAADPALAHLVELPPDQGGLRRSCDYG